MHAMYSRGNTRYPWLTSLFGFGDFLQPLYLFAALSRLKSEMQSFPSQHIQTDLALCDHFAENRFEVEVFYVVPGIFDLIQIDKLNFIQRDGIAPEFLLIFMRTSDFLQQKLFLNEMHWKILFWDR